MKIKFFCYKLFFRSMGLNLELILLGLMACLYSVYQIISSILIFNGIILGLKMILEVLLLPFQFSDF